ncbi:MAG: RsmE family RNA methyltransferase [Bacteroidota bacterium]|nr:RsmE family RNA methyltransferase [Bacteroidota bacterium]
MHSFYAPDINGKFYELSKSESKHAKVLRLGLNDRIRLLDGLGGVSQGVIRNISSKNFQTEITDKQIHKPKAYRFELVVAPPKTAARLEFMIEKLGELEVDKLTLLVSEFSERKKVKEERLNRILIAALKQSKNFYKTELNVLPLFGDYIKEPFAGQRLIAHCYDTEKPNVQDVLVKGQNTQLLIGPEGDFSLQEIKAAAENGYREINLTTSRLRTETAALYSAIAVDLVNIKT